VVQRPRTLYRHAVIAFKKKASKTKKQHLKILSSVAFLLWDFFNSPFFSQLLD